MAKTQPIKAARGVRDILPSERPAWRVAERAAEQVARRFGYQEIVTPLIEAAELIERVGEDTDVVSKEVYRFQDRGERWLALRPEGTAGVVRAYFEGGLNQGPQPVRLFLSGAMFRYDRPQKGRYRQFYQFDIEVIGSDSAALDAEVIEVAHAWIEAMGLREVALDLNSIGDASCRPAFLEKLQAYYRPLAPKLHPECRHRLETQPLRLLDCKHDECKGFKAGAPRITDHLCVPCRNAFAEVRHLLDAAGIEYRLNPYLVRGLDYYTRTVFEFLPTSLRGGAQDAVGGGGRYDGLAAAIGYPDTPAVGFAGGLDRAVLVMQGEGSEIVAEPAADVVVLAEAELATAAASVARICREVRTVAVDYEAKSLKAKMRAADKLGARWVILLTAAEASHKKAQLKNMASGEQEEVAWSDLVARLQ
jgi:histidyl-tRNA synthetase